MSAKGKPAGKPSSAQPSKFIEAALALSCADDEAAFDEDLRAITSAGAGRDHGKVAGDEGEGGDPKATAPGRKGR